MATPCHTSMPGKDKKKWSLIPKSINSNPSKRFAHQLKMSLPKKEVFNDERNFESEIRIEAKVLRKLKAN
jgi:hypothetical protein